MVETVEAKTVLITGASGLLGRALVDRFSSQQYTVFAHYFSHPQANSEHVHWLQGDLSSMGTIDAFLSTHHAKLASCQVLINNYGPLTAQPFSTVSAADILRDYLQNTITAIALIRFMIAHAPISAVVNIGFADAGRSKPYQRITGYAAAKNALLLFTRSYAAAYPHIRFNMVSPRTLQGARTPKRRDEAIPPAEVAECVWHEATGKFSGRHVRI